MISLTRQSVWTRLSIRRSRRWRQRRSIDDETTATRRSHETATWAAAGVAMTTTRTRTRPTLTTAATAPIAPAACRCRGRRRISGQPVTFCSAGARRPAARGGGDRHRLRSRSSGGSGDGCGAVVGAVDVGGGGGGRTSRCRRSERLLRNGAGADGHLLRT